MSGYRLGLELKGLPRMANIASGASHWRHADKERKLWQTMVWFAVVGRKPPSPLKRVHLIMTRYSSSMPDYDGLVRGFKSVVDGLVKAGVMENDKLSNTGAWDCRWELCKLKQGRILVDLREVTE